MELYSLRRDFINRKKENFIQLAKKGIFTVPEMEGIDFSQAGDQKGSVVYFVQKNSFYSEEKKSVIHYVAQCFCKEVYDEELKQTVATFDKIKERSTYQEMEANKVFEEYSEEIRGNKVSKLEEETYFYFNDMTDGLDQFLSEVEPSF